MPELTNIATDEEHRCLVEAYARELGYGLSTVLAGSKETLAKDADALLRHKGWTFIPYVWEFAPIDPQVAENRVRMIADVTEFISSIWCPSTDTIREMIDIAGHALDVLALVPVQKHQPNPSPATPP